MLAMNAYFDSKDTNNLLEIQMMKEFDHPNVLKFVSQ